MITPSEVPSWSLIDSDGSLVGRLELEEDDWPWTKCRFEPGPRYTTLAPLFERELQGLACGDWNAWREAANAILALRLELRPEGGGAALRPSLVRVDLKHAWFRD
jgi:hypothetical protein